MPRFAANISMLFNEVPFLERFSAAARAGFHAVEFLFPYAHDKRLLSEFAQRHELEVVLFNMAQGNWAAGDRGIACHPGRTGEFQDAVASAADYAAALGCRRIHCMAGLRPRGVTEERMRETYVANLRLAAAELGKHGVQVLIEAINTRDIPGYYLTTTRQAFDVIRDVAMPNVLFQFDVYHVQIMEGDLAPKLEEQVRQIGHMQLADTPGRHEPGTGEINYPFLFQHIDRIGYQGWMGCEYRPLTTTDGGLAWIRPWLRPGDVR